MLNRENLEKVVKNAALKLADHTGCAAFKLPVGDSFIVFGPVESLKGLIEDEVKS